MNSAAIASQPLATSSPALIAATVELGFDYRRIEQEIRACAEFFVDTPPYEGQVERGLSGEIPFMSESQDNYRRIDVYGRDGVERHELRGAKIFDLRNSSESDVLRDARYSVTKGLSHDSWYWRPEIRERIPYTASCIESLPYRMLGLVRAFVCESTFMPTHRDTVPDGAGKYDRDKALGLSLIPSTGGVGMLIWDDAGRRVHEVRGNCVLFDDSKWHGVPMTRGLRITMRIFGELDHARLRRHFTATFPS